MLKPAFNDPTLVAQCPQYVELVHNPFFMIFYPDIEEHFKGRVKACVRMRWVISRFYELMDYYLVRNSIVPVL